MHRSHDFRYHLRGVLYTKVILCHESDFCKKNEELNLTPDDSFWISHLWAANTRDPLLLMSLCLP